MSRLTPMALLPLIILVGCAYFNSLYNAKRAFREAESARLRGESGTAATRYAEAIDKAAKSFRSDEDGRWADDALLLMGRSYVQRGEWARAEAALERVLTLSTDPEMRARAGIFLGATAVATGRRAMGLALLDAGLPVVVDPAVRAEGHLWRARASFSAGRPEEGWISLDEAAQGDGAFKVRTGLERLIRGVEGDDMDQAFRGATLLLVEPEGEVWADSIDAAVERATRLWGPAAAAALLRDVEQSSWAPGRRDRMRLLKADVLAQAGDTASARMDAEAVASGVGRLADEARVTLARWRLKAVDDVEELDGVRGLLLPALGLPEAVRLLEAIKRVGLFVERAGGDGDALALFAGAEMARDSLGSHSLARQLFMVYADRDRGSAWEAKALMATLELTEDLEERRTLTARLDAMPDNVYVQASRRTAVRPTDFTVVERRLQSSLATLHQRVATEAQFRDVVVSETARTLDSIRTAEELRRRIAEGDSVLLDSLRLDSLRVDSLRLDSMRADSIRRDSLPWDTIPRRDTIPRSLLLDAIRVRPRANDPEESRGAA